MRLITSLLLALALLALAHPLVAQPITPLVASVQIVDPGPSRLTVFSVIYTATVVWPDTAPVTVTTTIPAYLRVASAPGCTHILNRIGCTVQAQAGQSVDIVLRFSVPRDVRGEVAIDSTAVDGAGGSASAGASFVVPPQMSLPLVLC
jgi:hypothetical protein